MGRSAGVVFCLMFGIWLPVDGQNTGDSVRIHRSMQTRVATALAERWRASPSNVVLEWGHVPSGRHVAPDTPFDIRGRATGTNFTIVFSPPGKTPVAITLRAGLRVATAVAARPLGAGHVVERADLVWGEDVAWGEHVHEATTSELPIGWRVRSSIALGQPVRKPYAMPPPAVRAGALVDVVWRRGVVQVSVPGTAMSDANAGEHVGVRLENNRGRVRGIANKRGQVEISKK